jgi:hypothetical protein
VQLRADRLGQAVGIKPAEQEEVAPEVDARNGVVEDADRHSTPETRMNATQNLPAHGVSGTHYLLFRALFESPRSLSFPCDAGGHVHLDGLSARALDNYLFARTAIGHDYYVPIVVPALEDA